MVKSLIKREFMKKGLFFIFLSCFLGFTFSSCSDSSEPENSGEVEQTASAWAIGTWKTTADVAEENQREFRITDSSFQWLGDYELEEYVFDKEMTLENQLTGNKYTTKWSVSKSTDTEFVLDSYVDGENLGPHFGLEKDGDKFYYRIWDIEKGWGLTKDRWEVVKK